jgi:hypothetical protein
MFQYATDSRIMMSMAHLSLKERVEIINSKFKTDRLSVYYLRRLFQQQGIKKKQIVSQKGNKNRMFS